MADASLSVLTAMITPFDDAGGVDHERTWWLARFLVGTGSTLTHVYEAVYAQWDEFHHSNPANNFRLDGLTVNSVVVHSD